MNFDDRNQPIVWRDRKSCENITQPELMYSMMAEAKLLGYEPMDFNWSGSPNIYLRGRYHWVADVFTGKVLEETYESDGFCMFIRKKLEKKLDDNVSSEVDQLD